VPLYSCQTDQGTIFKDKIATFTDDGKSITTAYYSFFSFSEKKSTTVSREAERKRNLERQSNI